MDGEQQVNQISEMDDNFFEIFKTPMKFGTENNTEVTAQIGTTAHLPCMIHNIGEGVVSRNEIPRSKNWIFMKKIYSITRFHGFVEKTIIC